jgi:hypothetical protein
VKLVQKPDHGVVMTLSELRSILALRLASLHVRGCQDAKCDRRPFASFSSHHVSRILDVFLHSMLLNTREKHVAYLTIDTLTIQTDALIL